MPFVSTARMNPSISSFFSFSFFTRDSSAFFANSRSSGVFD